MKALIFQQMEKSKQNCKNRSLHRGGSGTAISRNHFINARFETSFQVQQTLLEVVSCSARQALKIADRSPRLRRRQGQPGRSTLRSSSTSNDIAVNLSNSFDPEYR